MSIINKYSSVLSIFFHSLLSAQTVRAWPEHVKSIQLRSYYSSAIVSYLSKSIEKDPFFPKNTYIAICSFETINNKTKMYAYVFINYLENNKTELIKLNGILSNIESCHYDLINMIENSERGFLVGFKFLSLKNTIENIHIKNNSNETGHLTIFDGYPSCVVIMNDNTYLIRQSSGRDSWGAKLEIYISNLLSKYKK